MITRKLLEELNACEPQIDLFDRTFPNGTEVTVENAVSVADQFDWWWAARNLLKPEGFEMYLTVEQEVMRVFRDDMDALYKRTDIVKYSEECNALHYACSLTYYKAIAEAWANAYLAWPGNVG